MKIHPSALKQGTRLEDPLPDASWPRGIEPLEEDDYPHKELRLGFDTQARLLDTVVLVFASGDELVIHAMAARRQYWVFFPEERPGRTATPGKILQPLNPSG